MGGSAWNHEVVLRKPLSRRKKEIFVRHYALKVSLLTLKPFCQDDNLGSQQYHTLLSISDETYYIRYFSWQFLLIFKVFARTQLRRGNHQKKYFFIFCFLRDISAGIWITNSSLTNLPHFLLDYCDFRRCLTWR